MSVDASFANTGLGDTQTTPPETTDIDSKPNIDISQQENTIVSNIDSFKQEVPNAIDSGESKRTSEDGQKTSKNDSRTVDKTDTAYLDEIKRRKFDKKAKNKLFVGGLVVDATEEFLYQRFLTYGEIIDACIVYEKGTHTSRGFGYVTFGNEKDAEDAIKGADGMRINGKTLCVEYADDPKSSNARRPPPRQNRSRSPPPYPRDRRYPPHPRPYRDHYPERYQRDRFYDDGPYFERGHYDRDTYESERHYRRDPYESYYPPGDHYRPPPGYRRSPPRMPYAAEYHDRFGRDVPPGRPPMSDLDHARLRVDREQLRDGDYYEDERISQGGRHRRSPIGDNYQPRARNNVPGTHAHSDSNSSDDDGNDRPKAKPRQVSAFPSAYLS